MVFITLAVCALLAAQKARAQTSLPLRWISGCGAYQYYVTADGNSEVFVGGSSNLVWQIQGREASSHHMWVYYGEPPVNSGVLYSTDINVVLAPNGKQVIVRTLWDTDDGIHSITTLLNMADGSVAGSLSLPDSQVDYGSLSISPDSKTLLVTGVDANYQPYVNLVRLSDGALLPGPATKLSSSYGKLQARFTSDGSTLLMFGFNPTPYKFQTEFWRVSDLSLQSVATDDGPMMDCSADCKSLLVPRTVKSGSSYTTLMDLVRTSDGTVLATYTSKATEQLTGRFSPDGKSIELAGDYVLLRSGYSELTEGVAELWRVSDQKLLNRNLTTSPSAIANGFLPDGKTFVLWANSIQYRSATDGSLLRSIVTDVDFIYSVAVSPDGQHVARAGIGRDVYGNPAHVACLLNTGDGAVATAFPSSLSYSEQVVYSHDGKVVACAGYDMTGYPAVELWTVATGKLISRLHLPSGNPIALSPDGTMIAVTATATSGSVPYLQLTIVRVKDGTVIATANTGFDSGVALGFSADGATVTVSGTNGPGPDYTFGLQQWKVSTGKSVWSLKTTNYTNLLALSSDGKTMACATHDYDYLHGTIELRTAATGALIRAIPGDHLTSISGLCWTPDNTMLIATGQPGEFWDIDAEELEWWSASTGASLGWRQIAGPVSAMTPDGSLLAGCTNYSAFTAPSPAFSSPSLKSLTLSAGSVKGGGSVTGTVTLTSVAPFDGTTVTLASSQGSIAPVPVSVTVVENTVKVSFTITTAKVTDATSVTITAKLGSVTQTATLNVTP
jgi:hypothetical protein